MFADMIGAILFRGLLLDWLIVRFAHETLAHHIPISRVCLPIAQVLRHGYKS